MKLEPGSATRVLTGVTLILWGLHLGWALIPVLVVAVLLVVLGIVWALGL